MYSPTVVARRIDQAVKAGEVYYGLPVGDGRTVKRFFEPTAHSVAEVDSSVRHLDALRDPEGGKLSRPLDEAEIAFIANERFLCRLDYLYYATRFAWIKDENGNNVRYSPRISQRIFQDVVAEHDLNEWPIELQVGKARQQGVSREVSLMFGQRAIFWAGTNAVLASADPEKSSKLTEMMKYPIDRLPWWLAPTPNYERRGEYIIYADQDSTITIEAGNQFNGLARGTTPQLVHLSELCEFEDPEELVEAALFPAIHPSKWTFLVCESTALGRGNWWHRSWKLAKEGWHLGRARLRPIFLPWFTGSDIYPTKDWIAMHREHIRNYTPAQYVIEHARAAEAYAASNPLLRKHLGAGWQMSIEQKFWYETKRDEYREKGILNKFLAEYCVAWDQRVSTEKGLIQIQDAVLEKAQSTRLGPVTAHFDNGVRDVVTIKTKNGRRLTVTPEHEVHCTRKGKAQWSQAKDLLLGDTLQLEPPTFANDVHVQRWPWIAGCEMSVSIDADWGRMLGYFLGDGCWGSNAVIVSCNAKDEDTVDDVSRLIERILGKYPLHQRQRGCLQVVSNSVRWFEILFNLDVLDHRYAKKQERNSGYRKRLRVPDCIWRSPRRVVAEFLRGLFESDGFANQTSAQITWFTKDEEFAREVQLLLLGFGVNALFLPQTRKYKGKSYLGVVLRLNARAAEIFYNEVGFVSHRKQTGKRPSVRLGRKADPINYLDEVVSVEPAGKAAVFDLTVAGSHQYGANGILVHNCSSDDEMFQSTNISVFPYEVVSRYRALARGKQPLGVFGLQTREDIFPKRLQPAARDIDFDSPSIDVVWPWGGTSGANLNFTMVPLKWEGYGEKDEDGNGKIFIFEMPDGRSDYGIGVDTGEGVGKDRSTNEVMRKGNVFARGAQVAEYASAYVNSLHLWPITACLTALYATPSGGRLKQPRVAIECRGNGDTVQNELVKRGLYNWHPWVRIDSKNIQPGKAHKMGVFTNNWFRKQVMDWLLSFLNDEKMEVNSPYFVNEMESLEADEWSQSMKAAYNEHDDRLMAMGFIIVSLHQLEIMRGQRPEDQNVQKDEDPIWTPPDYGMDVAKQSMLAKLGASRAPGVIKHGRGVTQRYG